MHRPLGYDELQRALAALVGARVSVRVVERSDPERLIAVFEGVLGAPSDEKSPSDFWPISDGLAERDRAAERFGIVLRADRFDEAEERVAGEVLVIGQGPVQVNVRRL
jgi:hypothetical protein